MPAIFRFVWFLCAVFMAINVVIWRRRMATLVGQQDVLTGLRTGIRDHSPDHFLHGRRRGVEKHAYTTRHDVPGDDVG